jgi:DNA polymerase-3 subunit delta
MPIRPEQLPAQLQRGLAPVYLIGGEEMLLVQECRDQVCAAARDQGFSERALLRADASFDWEELAATGAAQSLFSSRRIIDLRLPTGKPGRDGGKALTEWVQQPDPDVLLLVSCDKWDASSRKSKWAAALDRAGVRIDVWPIKPAEMPEWISRRMRQSGLEPDREAVMLLAERLEGNLLAARQEIEKLLLLKGLGPVSAADVTQSVADSARFDSFLLAEHLLAGRLADGLRVSTGLRRTGIPLQMVVGALYREFTVLEAFSLARQAGQNEQQAFRRLNIWPGRQPAMRAAAGRLGVRRLNDAFSRLAGIDRQGKGMADGDPWHALDRLVVALCRP